MRRPLLAGNGFFPPQECFPRAKAAATRALAIDGQLGEAHNTLGVVKGMYEWDWSGAEREYQRAIELNPRHALAHAWYSVLLIAMERREAAMAERKRAMELEPLSLMINQGSAAIFHRADHYDEAVKQARKVIEMDPNYWQGHWHLGRAYEQKGRHEEAIAELQKAVDLLRAPKVIGELGYVYAASGKRAEAEKVIGELEELSKRQYVSPSFIAAVYAALGEKEQAFQWLNKAYEGRAQIIMFLKVDPTFHSLRSDPRFADLVRRVGLPP
jgi:tetratricopeptide (TPR) repeat protein